MAIKSNCPISKVGGCVQQFPKPMSNNVIRKKFWIVTPIDRDDSLFYNCEKLLRRIVRIVIRKCFACTWWMWLVEINEILMNAEMSTEKAEKRKNRKTFSHGTLSFVVFDLDRNVIVCLAKSGKAKKREGEENRKVGRWQSNESKNL